MSLPGLCESHAAGVSEVPLCRQLERGGGGCICMIRAICSSLLFRKESDHGGHFKGGYTHAPQPKKRLFHWWRLPLSVRKRPVRFPGCITDLSIVILIAGHAF